MSNESHPGGPRSPASAGRKIAQLHAIAAELMGCRTERAVHRLTVAAAQRVLAFEGCAVETVEDGRLVTRAAAPGSTDAGTDDAAAGGVPLAEAGVAGEAVRRGEAVVVDDVDECAFAGPADGAYRSALAVPLDGEGQVEGVFRAGAGTGEAFDDADRRLAELLVSHAAAALRRVRSEAALRARNRTVAELHETAAELVRCDREDDVYEAVVDAAEAVLGFRVPVVLAAPEDDPDVLEVQAASGDLAAPAVGATVPADGTVVGEAFETGQPVVYADGETGGTDGSVPSSDATARDDAPETDDENGTGQSEDGRGAPEADDETGTAETDGESGAADPAGGDGRTASDDGDSRSCEPYHGGYRSALAVPLGEVGVLQALSGEPDAFDGADRELAELLATGAGAVVARLRAQRRRADEHERLAALFENVPDPAVRVRFEDDRPVVRAVNPAFEETFGYGADEAVGRDVDELIVPEREREAAAAVNRAVRRGESFHRETRRLTADGELRAFLVHLVPIERGEDNTGAFAIYTDVTERERREQRLGALQEATRDLLAADDAPEACEVAVRAARDILDLAVGGVYLLEGERLEPVAWTDTAGELYGDDPPTLGPEAGGVWGAFESGDPRVVHPADGEHVDAALVVPMGEHGVFITAAPTATAYTDQVIELAGVLAATVETALDRTERERVLRERERELARQNERLERFASVVSHDLRGPLSVARGNLELARETGDLTHLETVESAHRRMDAMVDDVLTLARQGEVVGSTEPVDVERVARRAWAGIDAPTAELTAADPGHVGADPDRLLQLLENLLANAVDHGGPAVEIEVGSLDDGGFYVADDGPGVPAEERETVLEYGHTTADDGTGLGLAIVAEIAEAHGWSLAVAESGDGGARFEVHTG